MRIYVEELDRRGLFRATYRPRPGAESVIVDSSRQPLLDAARYFKARGMTGTLEMWDDRRPYPRMSGDIDKLAGLTIKERDRSGLRVERWIADSRFPKASPAAV